MTVYPTQLTERAELENELGGKQSPLKVNRIMQHIFV